MVSGDVDCGSIDVSLGTRMSIEVVEISEGISSILATGEVTSDTSETDDIEVISSMVVPVVSSGNCLGVVMVLTGPVSSVTALSEVVEGNNVVLSEVISSVVLSSSMAVVLSVLESGTFVVAYWKISSPLPSGTLDDWVSISFSEGSTFSNSESNSDSSLVVETSGRTVVSRGSCDVVSVEIVEGVGEISMSTPVVSS